MHIGELSWEGDAPLINYKDFLATLGKEESIVNAHRQSLKSQFTIITNKIKYTVVPI